ncbi:hypothetical protein [Caulobacter sp. 17J65-9]|uniref:hypothetical protein n=1 Tax=Caulobacter sp. 17J65-9 TaxID=2709382 RepID=UPI0013C8006E|nr:hypothetical protein [Caulobacter sp. 17J65-9]NEX92231.1 hypothetical protein [Caulobacter sp. 17J65-9]
MTPITDKTIQPILYVSGAVTALAGALQFAAPTLFLTTIGMQVGEPAGLLFARHWGLLVACIGALLIYAAGRPQIRRPIVLAGAAEKAGIAVMLAMNWSEPALQGMRAAAAFDGVLAVIYLVYLLQRPVPAASPATAGP